MKKKLLALAVLILLVSGIYWGIQPQEEYEVIVVKGTLGVTALEEAGFLEAREDTGFRRGPCEICEAIQRGEITLTSWLEESDNFTVIMKEGAYELDKPVFKFYPNNTHNIEVEKITSEE